MLSEVLGYEHVFIYRVDVRMLAERFVRSIKEECLDRLIPLKESHRRHTIGEYVEHYHRERNHQGLDNRLIAGASASHVAAGRLRRRQQIGGLLNFCDRAA